MGTFFICLIFCFLLYTEYKIFWFFNRRVGDEDTKILLFGLGAINFLLSVLNYELATILMGVLSLVGFLIYLFFILKDEGKLKYGKKYF